MDAAVMEALRIYSLFSIVLGLSVFALGGITGVTRTRTRSPVIADDEALLRGTVKEVLPLELQRALNCHRNALENIPPFLLMALPFVLTGPTVTQVTLYMGIYTAVRLLYIVAYLRGLQPWRTIFFGIGNVTVLIMAGHTLFRLLA